MDREAGPSMVTVTARGLEIFPSHVIDNYSEVRRQIACQVVKDVSSGRQIEAAISQLKLVVSHVLSEFASRRWLMLHQAGDIFVAAPTAKLRRLCQET